MERQEREQWKGQGFPVEPGMTRTRAVEMMERAKGMTERVNIGKDGEKPIGKTRGRTVERTGIPGRAGNDGEENRNDGEEAVREQWKERRKSEGRAKEVRMKNEERRMKGTPRGKQNE